MQGDCKEPDSSKAGNRLKNGNVSVFNYYLFKRTLKDTFWHALTAKNSGVSTSIPQVRPKSLTFIPLRQSTLPPPTRLQFAGKLYLMEMAALIDNHFVSSLESNFSLWTIVKFRVFLWRNTCRSIFYFIPGSSESTDWVSLIMSKLLSWIFLLVFLFFFSFFRCRMTSFGERVEKTSNFAFSRLRTSHSTLSSGIPRNIPRASCIFSVYARTFKWQMEYSMVNHERALHIIKWPTQWMRHARGIWWEG